MTTWPRWDERRSRSPDRRTDSEEESRQRRHDSEGQNLLANGPGGGGEWPLSLITGTRRCRIPLDRAERNGDRKARGKGLALAAGQPGWHEPIRPGPKNPQKFRKVVTSRARWNTSHSAFLGKGF